MTMDVKTLDEEPFKSRNLDFHILNKFFRIFGYIKKLKILEKIKKVGYNFQFDYRSEILTPRSIEIGNNVFIGDFAHIAADLRIGNNSIFGSGLTISGGDHLFAVKGKSIRFLSAPNRENVRRIIIEDEVWCGSNVTILRGVRVGIGSVIGAGSVVSRDVPPFTLNVGNPCHPIKILFSDDVLQEHLRILGYSDKKTKNIIERRFKHLKSLNKIDLPVIDNTVNYENMFREIKNKEK